MGKLEDLIAKTQSQLDAQLGDSPISAEGGIEQASRGAASGGESLTSNVVAVEPLVESSTSITLDTDDVKPNKLTEQPPIELSLRDVVRASLVDALNRANEMDKKNERFMADSIVSGKSSSEELESKQSVSSSIKAVIYYGGTLEKLSTRKYSEYMPLENQPHKIHLYIGPSCPDPQWKPIASDLFDLLTQLQNEAYLFIDSASPSAIKILEFFACSVVFGDYFDVVMERNLKESNLKTIAKQINQNIKYE